MDSEKKTPQQIAAEIKAKSQKDYNAKYLKVSRGILIVLVLIQVYRLYTFIAVYNLPAEWLFPDIIVAIVFCLAAGLSFINPKAAFIIAVFSYVALQLYLLSYGWEYMIQGWIWKVMILTGLIIGLKSALNLPPRRLEDEDLLDV